MKLPAVAMASAPPVLRAAVMTAIIVIGGFFFRRLELLNSAAIAALILLMAEPLALRDSSFQLTFAAIGCIAGLAVPWLEKTAQPYVRALRGWRDVTRDAAHEPRAEAKNDDSLVLKLQYGNKGFLLPGDAEKQAERGILGEIRPEILRSAVLKVGHHGVKNSTTQEFLRAVEPSIGIISVGEANPYGHPSPELLERLEALGARVLRTDRDGALHVLTDGQQLELSCFVACPGAARVASTLAKIPDQNKSSDKK